jgi:hypothetical protein
LDFHFLAVFSLLRGALRSGVQGVISGADARRTEEDSCRCWRCSAIVAASDPDLLEVARMFVRGAEAAAQLAISRQRLVASSRVCAVGGAGCATAGVGRPAGRLESPVEGSRTHGRARGQALDHQRLVEAGTCPVQYRREALLVGGCTARSTNWSGRLASVQGATHPAGELVATCAPRSQWTRCRQRLSPAVIRRS